MPLLICLVVAVCLMVFPTFRCAVSHPVLVVKNAVPDFVRFIRLRLWRNYKTGELNIYCGYFGKGKTLSAVHKVVSVYNRYDGLTVWDDARKKFVTQKILVLSNVNLTIPYRPLESLGQIVALSKLLQETDTKNDTLTCMIVLLDELSVQLNSRSFKDNIDAYFLNTMMCCRHYHISFYGTAQRFGHVDKMMRDVTNVVIQCDKLWRFQRQSVYDAWELEQAQSPALVRPLFRTCWFVQNADYAAYDTLAVVGNLAKKYKEGDMLTEAEVLAKQQPMTASLDSVTQPSRLLRKRRKTK